MSYISKTKDITGVEVVNSFTKQVTAGDVFRVDVREPGKVELVSILGSTTTTFTLSWHYQVGMNQLLVFMFDDAGAPSGQGQLLMSADTWSPTVPTSYYTELTSNTVSVVNGVAATKRILFVIPHTSTPGSFASKVVVNGQADHAGIELEGAGDGIILTSISGYKYLLRIDNEGNMATQRIV